mmetsp:Transcript_1902/g.11601  ORF Transcript_1902/g.11601 Transcript_1902/m.11601 type:complete len:313 (-) Transcript_1902:1009-1947(-)
MSWKARFSVSPFLCAVLAFFSFSLGRFWEDLPGLPTHLEDGLIDSNLMDLNTFPDGNALDSQPQLSAYPSGHLPGMPMDLPGKSPLSSKSPESDEYVSMVPFQIISWHPRIIYYPGFANNSVCDKMVHIASASMKVAAAHPAPKGVVEEQSNNRGIAEVSLPPTKDRAGILAWVEEKIARVSLLPASYGEPMKIFKYDANQGYEPHYDTLDHSYGPQSGQRVATFLLFLSSWEGGGETLFPLEGAENLKRLRSLDYGSCNLGLKVSPQKGDGLLLLNANPDATIDMHALHGGCPVVQGEKWLAKKWINDKKR